MNNSSHTQADQLAELSKYIGELMELSLNQPEEAIPKIQAFDNSLVSAGVKPNESVHLLYSLAYGKLASIKDDQQGANAQKEIIRDCEKSLSEYRLADQLAQYDTTETYQEEIIVKPAGLFKKAQTELRTQTRTVRKSRLDPKLVAQPLDHICKLLEKYSPGGVHRILGEVKLKYLGAAGRWFYSRPVQGAMEHGLLTKQDLLSIGEIAVTASGPILSVLFMTILSGGNEPKILLTLFDKPEPIAEDESHANVVGTCIIEKKNGIWGITKGV